MVQQPVYVFDDYQVVMMRHTPPINRSTEKIMQLKSLIVVGLIMAVLPIVAISAPQQGRGENPACSGLRSRLSNLRSQVASISRDLRSAQQSVSRYESDFRQAQLRASRAKTDSERRSAEPRWNPHKTGFATTGTLLKTTPAS